MNSTPPPPISTSIHPSIHPPTHPSIHPSIYLSIQMRLSGQSLANYVVLLWVEFGQPCHSARSQSTSTNGRLIDFAESDLPNRRREGLDSWSATVPHPDLLDPVTNGWNGVITTDNHGRSKHWTQNFTGWETLLYVTFVGCDIKISHRRHVFHCLT